MINKFYKILKDNNQNISDKEIQLCNYILYKNSIFNFNKEIEVTLSYSPEKKDTLFTTIEKNKKKSKYIIEQDLLKKDELKITSSILIKSKLLLNEIEKNDLINLMSAFKETTIDNFINNINNNSFSNSFEKTIENLNENGFKINSDLYYFIDSAIKENFNIGSLIQFYNRFDVYNFLKYNNGEEYNQNNIINETLKYSGFYLDDSVNFEMLSKKEIFEIIKDFIADSKSPVLECLFNSKHIKELYKNTYEKIIQPNIEKNLLPFFEFKINKIETIEDLLNKNTSLIDSINKIKKEHPYYFNHKENNLYEEFISSDEYMKLYYDRRPNNNNIEYNDLIIENKGHLSPYDKKEKSIYLNYSTESYKVLTLQYEIEKHYGNKSIMNVKCLEFNDIEKYNEESNKNLKNSIRKIFEIAERENSALSISTIRNITEIGSNEYISNCFDEIYLEFKSKVLFIKDSSKNYLLDMVHSTDLKLNTIIDNIDYINKENPVKSGKFDEVVLELIKKKNINKIK